MKKLKGRTVGGIIIAVLAAAWAFGEELQDQKRDKKIDDIDDRLAKLEQK